MYQCDPKDYAQNSGAQQIWAEELMDKRHLAGHERTLDLGCGDGKISRLGFSASRGSPASSPTY